MASPRLRNREILILSFPAGQCLKPKYHLGLPWLLNILPINCDLAKNRQLNHDYSSVIKMTLIPCHQVWSGCFAGPAEAGWTFEIRCVTVNQKMLQSCVMSMYLCGMNLAARRPNMGLPIWVSDSWNISSWHCFHVYTAFLAHLYWLFLSEDFFSISRNHTEFNLARKGGCQRSVENMQN